MVDFRFFLATLGVMLGTCAWLANPAPTNDAFSDLSADQSLALDGMAVEDIAALKLLHVAGQRPYEALLFGNSRSLPLQASDLGLDPATTFNLSLTGESLRSSILLLENLKDLGRSPRLALISFDNAELNYYSNPSWPPLGERWSQIVRDIEAGLARPTIPLREVGRVALRHLTTEATLLSRSFNFSRVRRGVAALLFGDRELAPRTPTNAGYRPDGSRPQSPPKTPYTARSLPVPNRNVLPGYLDYDLERLAAVQARGTRIVIYETPLIPELQREAMLHPSSVAAETRSSFLDLCARRGIECHSSPPVFDDQGLPWPDAGHPPAPALAAWIRTFLTPTRQSVSR